MECPATEHDKKALQRSVFGRLAPTSAWCWQSPGTHFHLIFMRFKLFLQLKEIKLELPVTSRPSWPYNLPEMRLRSEIVAPARHLLEYAN